MKAIRQLMLREGYIGICLQIEEVHDLPEVGNITDLFNDIHRCKLMDASLLLDVGDIC